MERPLGWPEIFLTPLWSTIFVALSRFLPNKKCKLHLTQTTHTKKRPKINQPIYTLLKIITNLIKSKLGNWKVTILYATHIESCSSVTATIYISDGREKKDTKGHLIEGGFKRFNN